RIPTASCSRCRSTRATRRPAPTSSRSTSTCCAPAARCRPKRSGASSVSISRTRDSGTAVSTSSNGASSTPNRPRATPAASDQERLVTYRVIQWSTGNVGRHAVRLIAHHPELELVGLWVHSADKAGKDAGELVGIEHLGVTATNDVDALLALDADCVCYTATADL